MTDLDLLHFEQLKTEVQARFLEGYAPSDEDISQWKGIDITYFQEDLLKRAKGSISEKSFYTYFKSSPVAKIPRIDLLNLLSLYCGYPSWYDFKKKHQSSAEILERESNAEDVAVAPKTEPVLKPKNLEPATGDLKVPSEVEKPLTAAEERKSRSEKERLAAIRLHKKKLFYRKLRKYLWFGISMLLGVIVLLLVFRDSLFSKTYQFHFVDADRESAVQKPIEVRVLKSGESPLTYRLAPGKDFVYTTKDKTLKMALSSTFYQPDTIIRNLTNSPDKETIELKPNEYNMMLYSYSTTKDFRNRKAQLENLISNNALIYQVFDNKYFNVETMTKQRYIAFLSLPTTSLENLDVIETQIKDGKIVLIKFRIKMPENENKK